MDAAKQNSSSSSSSGIPVIAPVLKKSTKKGAAKRTANTRTAGGKKRNAAPKKTPDRKVKFISKGCAVTMTVTGERFPDMKNLKDCGGKRIVNTDNTRVTIGGSIVNANHCQIDADACIINGDDCLVNGNNCIANGNRGRMWGNLGTINGSGWTIRGAVATQNNPNYTLDGGSIHTLNASGSTSFTFGNSSGSSIGRQGGISVFVEGRSNATAIGGGSAFVW